MLFTRRVLQRCLDELDWLSEDHLEHLVEKLNSPGAARLPSIWEVVILSALGRIGRIEYEQTYATGRRPDISFSGAGHIAFVADITCVSDSGLDADNPVQEFSDAIEACKSRLGLPIGGLNLRIEGQKTKTARGEKTQLLLPRKKDIQTFVKQRVEPIFREQLSAGATALECVFNEPGICFSARVEGGRYSSISHPGYDRATSLTQNPLFNALKGKANKLKGIPGLKGIIVCDGDCAALAPRMFAAQHEITGEKIAAEFLRQNSSIRFVLTISAKQGLATPLSRSAPPELVYNLVTQPSLAEVAALDSLFREMAAQMPRPKDTPVNGAARAREQGYGWGKHGCSTMSGKSLKISSRLILEVLAGRRSASEMNRLQRWRATGEPRDNETFLNPFERWLEDGRLPTEITVEADPEGTDDLISFVVGEPDAAISPFRMPTGAYRWRRIQSIVRRLAGRVWLLRG